MDGDTPSAQSVVSNCRPGGELTVRLDRISGSIDAKPNRSPDPKVTVILLDWSPPKGSVYASPELLLEFVFKNLTWLLTSSQTLQTPADGVIGHVQLPVEHVAVSWSLLVPRIPLMMAASAFNGGRGR